MSGPQHLPEAGTGAEAGGRVRVPLHVALVEAVVLREEGVRTLLSRPAPVPAAGLGPEHWGPTCLRSCSVTWEPLAAV